MMTRAAYLEHKFDEFVAELAAALRNGEVERPLNFRRDLTWNIEGIWAVDIYARFVPHDSIRYFADHGIQNVTVEIS